MNFEQFCYWLYGYFEIQNIGTKLDMEGIHPEQARIIREHLRTVFQDSGNLISDTLKTE